ncbi:hypothetical protein TRVL_06058 [Trypanosoma vivax]|nr:hypothetical protein TRVL_06058 [Trypanosoma vivax]
MTGIWMSALGQLQRLSWDLGQVPTACQWLCFFAACSAHPVAKASGCSFASMSPSGHSGGGKAERNSAASASTLTLPLPLPRHVRTLIAESVIDAVRLARLQQLFVSPNGIVQAAYQESSGMGKESALTSIDDTEDVTRCKIPVDVCGVFLCRGAAWGREMKRSGALQSDLQSVLCAWCISHETPQSTEQLHRWLCEVTKVLHYFLLQSQVMSDEEEGVDARMYLEYPNLLSVLHHSLYALFGRARSTTVASGSQYDTHHHQEAALLSLWLLKEYVSNTRGSGLPQAAPTSGVYTGTHIFTSMLRETQQLLAFGQGTRVWLLDLPAFLKTNAEAARASTQLLENSTALESQLKESPVCQLARETVPRTEVVPNIGTLFVDPHRTADASTLRAMSDELSRIALGSRGM